MANLNGPTLPRWPSKPDGTVLMLYRHWPIGCEADAAKSALERFNDALSAVSLSNLAAGIESAFQNLETEFLSADTLGKMANALSGLISGPQALRVILDNLERIITSPTASKAMKQFAKQLHDSLEGAYPEPGKTYAQIEEEQQRAAEEAKRKAEQAAREAEQAAREAEQAAREAAQRAQEAFREQFTAPIFKAISTGDWMSAAQAIKEFAQNREGFIQMASSLSDANGQRIDAIEVMGLITGAYRELLSQLDAQIQLMQWAGEDASALEELKQSIEDLFDPLGALRGQIRSILGLGPTEAGGKLRDLLLATKPGEKTWSLLMQAYKDHVSEIESLIGEYEILGLSTDDLITELDEFKAAMRGLTAEAAQWQDRWTDITKQVTELIMNKLKAGFLTLLRKLLGLEEAVTDLGTALNIPMGYKVARAAWRAARPGEPGLAAETEAGATSFWDDLLKILSDALVEWTITDIVSKLTGWLINDILGPPIQWFITDIVSPIAQWVWENVLVGPAQWVWENIIKGPAQWVWENLIKGPAQWVWEHVIKGPATWVWEHVIQGPNWSRILGNVARLTVVAGSIILGITAGREFGDWLADLLNVNEQMRDFLKDISGIVGGALMGALMGYLLGGHPGAWLGLLAGSIAGAISAVATMQEGGRTLSEGLAYLHPNEIVLPAAKVAALPASMGTGQLVIHTHVYLRDREIAEAVNEVNRDTLGRKTGSTAGWRY